MSAPYAARIAAAIVSLTLLGACPSSSPPLTEDNSTTMGTDTPTGPMETTFTAPDACQSSGECEGDDEVCVAPYDPAQDPPVGSGACVEACIEVDDLSQWCFDDAACCAPLRCNEADGFCEPLPGADSGSSDSGSSDSGSSGTDSSGSSGTDSGSSGSDSGSSGTSGGGSSSGSSSGT